MTEQTHGTPCSGISIIICSRCTQVFLYWWTHQSTTLDKCRASSYLTKFANPIPPLSLGKDSINLHNLAGLPAQINFKQPVCIPFRNFLWQFNRDSLNQVQEPWYPLLNFSNVATTKPCEHFLIPLLDV